MCTKLSEGARAPKPEDTAADLLDVVQQLLVELHPYRVGTVSVTLDSTLERALGFDSLGRVELLGRLERVFEVRLPEQLLVTAETPRDLLRAVRGARPAGPLVGPAEVRRVMPVEAQAMPLQASTLVDLLDWHVHAHPQRLHIHLYGQAEQVEEITYAALHQGATAIAAGLQERGLQPGQTTAIMLPTSRNFFESFYGILLAGGIPVPLYPPMRRSQLADHLHRQMGILSSARAAMLITVREAQPLARLLRSQVEGLRSVVTVQDLTTAKAACVRPTLQAQDIALVQYTSGSTGTPKGVMLTHANLLANIRAMGQTVDTTSADIFVSWLPLYHDMGLIGAWLGSLYYACLLVLMSPLSFLVRPERWLWAIHNQRGTMSGAPNFGYELCLRKVDDRDLAGLDLSSWRLAFNGAEPVSPETVRRFGERFAAYGFRPEAIMPVYGLAEAGLAVTFPPPGRGPRVDRIKRQPFMRTGRAVPADQDDPYALRFVGCGQPLPGHQIRIVDATGHEVAERQEGRLEFRGPSATSGYLHNPEETRRLFHGEWLDSGDLAYSAEGEVYLTGRSKDIIIRAGQNIYPHEVEEAIGNIPGVRKGCVAVFGSLDAVTRTERLVVLAETRTTETKALDTLRHQIDTLVVDLLGTPADDIVLAPPHTVLKTSSGKIRRASSRELYERGAIGRRQAAVWWQVTRLAVTGVVPQLRRLRQAITAIIYAAYAWGLFGLLAPFAWLSVVLLPRRRWRQAVVRVLARLALRLAGLPLIVQGLDQLPRHQPCVLVVNHASYVDVLVLLAALPGDLGYVAKRELAERCISRLPLRRLGAEFVERFDVQRSVEDTARVLNAVRQGRAVVFFPEGTFRRETGLRPFYMGAFVVAAQAGVPVVPLALRGTRSVLRANQWFPRRGTVRITIGAPLTPHGTDWAAAVQLQKAARAHILRYCGEPDLESAVSMSSPGISGSCH